MKGLASTLMESANLYEATSSSTIWERALTWSCFLKTYPNSSAPQIAQRLTLVPLWVALSPLLSERTMTNI